MHILFVLHGTDQGIRFPLTPESTTTIGRDMSCHIQLHDPEVSRHHAEIHRNGNIDFLIDIDSSNGVFVNGKRIRNTTLQNGDRIQIGRTLLLFSTPVPQAIRRSHLDSVEVRDDGILSPTNASPEPFSSQGNDRTMEMTTAAEVSPWLEAARSHLQLMYRTALLVSRTLDVDHLLRQVMELVAQWSRFHRGGILLLDDDGLTLNPVAVHLAPDHTDRDWLNPGEWGVIRGSIVAYVLEHGLGVLTHDARNDERWKNYPEIADITVRDAICVPMRGRYDLLGIIYIDTVHDKTSRPLDFQEETMTADHLKLLTAIAHQAALAVEDTRYYLHKLEAERLAAIGQTTAILSHHIKNILQGVRGGAYLIDTGLADGNLDTVTRGWAIVERNQQRISQLALDLLTFSKDRKPCLNRDDFNRVVDETVETFRRQAKESGVNLRWKPEPLIPPFYFDTEQIHRAVANVLSNALDAAAPSSTEQAEELPIGEPPVGEPPAENRPERRNEGNDQADDTAGITLNRVELRSEWDAQARKVRLVIEDTGPGIPASECETIFKPFHSTKNFHGTGLGLPITQKILEEHGGEIRVETSHLGGARFVLELPLRTTPPENEDLLTSDVNDDNGMGETRLI